MYGYVRPLTPDEIYHYGIKGMKWGVRRSPEELGHNKYSVLSRTNRFLSNNVVTRNGYRVTSISDHASSQAQNRKVTTENIIDTIKNPLYIRKITVDDLGRKSQRFIGNKATVNINPDTGIITTLWPTGTKTRNKYRGDGK